MSLKSDKPYFDQEVVEAIVNNMRNQLKEANKTLSEEMETIVRAYIQSPKNAYENGILALIPKGDYDCTIVGDEIAYKVAEPTGAQIGEIQEIADESNRPTAGQISLVLKQQRAAKLSHALNMVNYYGRPKKLKIPKV